MRRSARNVSDARLEAIDVACRSHVGQRDERTAVILKEDDAIMLFSLLAFFPPVLCCLGRSG